MMSNALSILRRSVMATALTCVGLITASPTVTNAAVGRTPGAASVSTAGSAQYTIPLWVPPGTAGMQPTLALTYDHRSSNTLLGIGWNISGLSEIHRCPRTRAQDGQPRNVRNDTQDRFCLDGQKLRLVSGTYGSDGAEYRTEIDTFARIRSFGIAGNGPASFTVEQRDGRVYEYGNTTDSRIESVNQGTARAWALNQIRDPRQNAVLFSYGEDTANGGYRINSIQYTSNPGQGLSPAYTVSFTYENKPAGELDSEYVANSEVRQISRMTRIDVTFSTTLVRRYQFAYEPSLSASKRSRLESIQECAGAAVDCLPATTFAYQNSTVGLAAQSNSPATMPTAVFPFAIDVNGDGRDDLVYPSSATPGTGSWMVMLANSSGGFQTPAAVPGTTNQNYAGAIPIDYNSDGKIDLLAVHNASTWDVMLGTDTGLAAPASTGTPATLATAGANAAASDVDGDGREDLVWLDQGTASGGGCLCYRLREPGGSFSTTVQYLVGPLGEGWSFGGNLVQQYGYQSRRRLPDFNGDGRGDFAYAPAYVYFDPESQQTFVDEYWEILFAGGGGLPPMPRGPTWQFPKFLDMNGDGKDDYIFSEGNTWSAVLGTGAGFANGYSMGSPAGYTLNQMLVLDWDSDGSQDLLVRYAPTGTWHLFRFNGSGMTVTDTQIAVGSGWVNSAVGDFNGDDLEDIGYLSGTTWVFRPHAGLYPDLLLTATDGFGVSATFNYAPLTSANYTPYTDATFPTQDYRRPLYVVNSAARSDGAGGSYTQSFGYYGGRVNLEGRGFQGFYARRTQDSRNGLYSYEYFVREFPQSGMLFQSDLYQSNNSTLIRRVVNTTATMTLDSTANNQRYFPHVSSSTGTNYELGGLKNGQLISTVETNYTFDTSGNATTIAVTATDNDVDSPFLNQQWTSTTVKTISPQSGCLGLPTQVAVTNTAPGVPTLTRTTGFTPSYTNCRMSQSVTEPLSATYRVTHDLGYDTFGNLNSETVTGIGMTARATSLDWGTTGQFPISITNAAGEVTGMGYDYGLGVQTSQTAPNQIVTSWGHDVFARRTSELRPDGTSTTWSYANCGPSGCVNGNNRTILTETIRKTDNSVLTDRVTYLDQFDRPLVANERLLSGSYNRVEIQYDALGRVSQQSVPCLASSCTNYWSTFTYDSLNRVTLHQRPISATDPTLQSTSLAYLGQTTVVTDPQGKTATKITKVAGMSGRSKDHDGYYQTFSYDAFGSLTAVNDSLANTLFSATYDYGAGAYQRTTADMDLGTRSYTYNALGEMTAASDGKGQSFSFTYDALSRLKTRVEPEATTTFTYGNLASDHIGQLESVAMSGYSEAYTYDSDGRLTKRRITSDAQYDYDYGYDSTSGLLRTLSYPASTGSPLKLEYLYQDGILQQVKDFNSATVFWQANSMNQRGQLTQQTLGNGVVTNRTFDAVTGWVSSIQSGVGSGAALQNESFLFDRVGNLTQRQNGNLGLTENFYYDNLYRLAYSTLGTVTNLNLAYDAMGNITSRTDVAGGATWTYHATKKHAVVQAGSSSFTYSYDANGNAQTRNGYAIDWTSYNYPSVIRGPNKTMTFSYGPDRQRFRQIYENGSTTETTMYAGRLLEKVTAGGVTDWRHYISVGGQMVAVVSRKSNGTNATRYVLGDQQGSVSQILASNGTPYVSESFTAFGARRDASTWSGPCPCPDLAKIKDTTRRGYTEHEAIGGVSMGLNHMNGRVQDAITGRFLSPDPLVQAPGFTQSFNRYAYAFNNPLSWTDPSGFKSEHSDGIRSDCIECFGQGQGLGAGANGGSPADGPSRGGGWMPESSLWVLGNIYSGLPMFADYGIVPGPGLAVTPSPPRVPVPKRETGLCGAQPCSTAGVIDPLTLAANDLGDPIHLAQARPPSGGRRGPGGGRTGQRPVGPNASRVEQYVPGGSLRANEQFPRAHVLSEHVGRSVSQLQARLAANPRLNTASSFRTEAEAEAFIAEALSQAPIPRMNVGSGQWYQHGFRVELGHPTGVSVIPGAPSPAIPTGVRIVLRHNPGSDTGYYIYTAYPD